MIHIRFCLIKNMPIQAKSHVPPAVLGCTSGWKTVALHYTRCSELYVVQFTDIASRCRPGTDVNRGSAFRLLHAEPITKGLRSD